MNRTLWRRVFYVPLVVIALIGLLGCGKSREEKAGKRILEALQAKYGEEFVLDSIGGGWGTMNSNTLTAVVRPAEDKTLKVPVEITKDLKDVYDLYLNQAVARNERPRIKAIAEQFWPGSKIIISNDTRLGYPTDNDINMSYREFLEKNPGNTMLIMIYVNGDLYINPQGEIDEVTEMHKQLSFADRIAKQGYVSSRVSLVYAKPEMYNRFEEALKSSDTVDRYFDRETEKTGTTYDLTRTTFKIDKKGKIIESQEEIRSYFELWREEREAYIAHKSGPQ